MSSTSEHIRQPDWLSIQDQREWFEKFKIQTHQVVGLDLGQFQKFLNTTLYPYLTDVIQQRDLVQFSSDQENQLFRHFDLNKDQVLNQDEFALLCQSWLHKIYHRKSALIVVDVQNDFIDGSLALIKSPAEQDGAAVVPVINELLDANVFDSVVYTQDWHPSDHIGFHDNLHLRKYTTLNASITTSDGSGQDDATRLHQNEDGATSAVVETNNNSTSERKAKLARDIKVFDTVLFDEGRMKQILWPRHCVQGSWGAELHPKLKVTQNSIRILKGTLSHVDAYSAFWDNMRLNETDLKDELASRGVTDAFFCGLAYDYCVAASALDSRRANFMTYVIEDACRGISTDSINKMTNDMIDSDILIVRNASVCNYLAKTRDRVQINGDGHKIYNKRDDESTVEINSSNIMRSVDMRDMLVTICFKKAFVHLEVASAAAIATT